MKILNNFLYRLVKNVKKISVIGKKEEAGTTHCLEKQIE